MGETEQGISSTAGRAETGRTEEGEQGEEAAGCLQRWRGTRRNSGARSGC